MLTTPVFLPGEFHRQRSLVGFSPWGCKESDMTEQLSLTHFTTHMKNNYSFFLFKKKHWGQYYWKEDIGKRGLD